jgi:surface antigen
MNTLTVMTTTTSAPARRITGLRAAALFAAALALGACSSHAGPKETGGTLIGAAAGGLIGSNIGRGGGKHAAIAIGTLRGAFGGNKVGVSLDRADRAAHSKAAQESLERYPSGKTAEWHNPDNGHSGTVTPTRTYRSDSGTYCREFQQTVTIGGKTEDAYGTACRQPDGSWKIVTT